MKRLVVLRHSLTRKGLDRGGSASHLSPEGVWLARRAGHTLPAMAYVAVGDQPRHLETAVAMGFAVDEQVSWPSGYVDGEVAHHDQWSWDEPFVRYAELLAGKGGLAEVVREHLDHWRRVVAQVPDDGCALVVSSGGSIEPVLVAAAPSADHAGWGGPLHQLEGAVLTWHGPALTALAMVRLDGDPPCLRLTGSAGWEP